MRLIGFTLCLGLLGLACSSEGAGGALSAGGKGSVGGNGGTGSGGDPSDVLFSQDQVPRFDIELSADAIEALTGLTSGIDPRADDYVPATLRYGKETVENVGLRIKGEASFRPLGEKSAFKIKFDEFVPRQSFHGLRRLTLNNAVEDPSFMAERIAYRVFRAAQLPAPRCNNALVYVNGEFYGVYVNVEAEDKPFLARWFKDNDGNLFEETGSDLLPGAENRFELETNESAPDYSGLTELIAATTDATGENFSELISTKLDLEQFLRFAAAEAAVNQWDMYAYARLGPNNFRLYENPSDGRFVFLPWGMDMSMKSFSSTAPRFIPVFEVGRFGNEPEGAITAGLLFQKCLAEVACKSMYSRTVERMAKIYEELELDELAENHYAQLRPYIYLDPKSEHSKPEIDHAYDELRETIHGRVAALRKDLKGDSEDD